MASRPLQRQVSAGAAMATASPWTGSAQRQPEERLLGVSASGPNDAWAVGNTNMISFASHNTLAAHWDGTAWTIVPAPAAASGGRLASLYDVADFSPANAWAVGRGQGRPAAGRALGRHRLVRAAGPERIGALP